MINLRYLEIGGLVFLAIASSVWIFRKIQNSNKPKGRTRRNFEELETSAAWEKVGKIKSLYIYPVKSCAGVSFKEMLMGKNGPQSGKWKDRCFIIIDEKGILISARKITSTLFITSEFDEENNIITLKFPELPPVKVYLASVEEKGNLMEANIFNNIVPGLDCGDEAADWLTRAINRKCRLLYFGSAESSRKTVSSTEDYPLVNPDDTTMFTDSDAYLLINEASVMDLEKKTTRKHHSENFRPNLLVEGVLPYDEDNWSYLKTGDAIFRYTKPCPRCTFPTIDFKTAKRDPYMEPFKTLKTYRCPPGSNTPDFGIYLAVEKSGNARVGDDVFILRN